MWKSFKNLIKKIFVEEYELTVYYPAKVEVLADGSRIESIDPVIYKAKSIKKASDKHFIFVDTTGVRHEIKLVTPVSYTVRKTF